MRVSREQAAENRRRIVEVAGALFRERGFNGIGVADLMKEAGLTHGGFYGHFASKDDLAAEACTRTLAAAAERWERTAAAAPGDALAAIAAFYLAPAHRDAPAAGCPIAALAVDVARQGGPARRAFTGGLRPFVELLARCLPGRSAAAQRRAALASLSGLVGAVILARAVDDPALSDEILDAARAAAGMPGRGDSAGGP
ncbi:TetR/AcrR family transcriptional regulator [Azospirillum sp. ST 5-10]|uniref:TetR/AcrR family transcriptional regulator n=1 Tax=unclassified Azospirillum TaxID=2630922 RepID=UPI003F4A2778